MKTLSAVTLALVVSAVGGMTNGATAAPITYDFTGTASGNQALGASQTYAASGGPTITAISGSYAQSGTGMPVAGDAFTAGGQLVGNNRGTDEMGVGVCFGNGCNNGHIDDNPEIARKFRRWEPLCAQRCSSRGSTHARQKWINHGLEIIFRRRR